MYLIQSPFVIDFQKQNDLWSKNKKSNFMFKFMTQSEVV